MNVSQIDSAGLAEAVATMHARAYPAGCPGSCEACDARLGILYWLVLENASGLGNVVQYFRSYREASAGVDPLVAQHRGRQAARIYRERPGQVTEELVFEVRL